MIFWPVGVFVISDPLLFFGVFLPDGGFGGFPAVWPTIKTIIF